MYYDGKCITWQYYMVHLLIQKICTRVPLVPVSHVADRSTGNIKIHHSTANCMANLMNIFSLPVVVT